METRRHKEFPATISSSAALFLIDPKGERIGLFSAPHDINQITADLAQLMESA